ncbi:sugar fermentation stimulation protein [Helicobacter pylori]|uniref:Sugar fermentation stimulation protein n=2 Tax=Helicobacter pylori TaxID=210 RepID=A0A4Y4XJC1_HELPX|nr:sugar fermentation stimulation protein [Helicobacter pylori]
MVSIQKALFRNRLLKVTNKLKFVKIIIMIRAFNHYCRKITRGFVKTLIKNKEQKR